MESILKEKKLKVTKNRLKVLEYINKNEYVTLNELIKNLNIDKSTVYRIIDVLLENDIITTITFENETKYSLSKEHLHILECVKCHKKKKIETCPFDKTNYNDFIITKHSVVIEGICKNCQKK